MAYMDPVDVSGGQYKVMVENEHVRVPEMTLKAGESGAMHSHPTETVYFENGGNVRVHLPDGGSAELEPPDGFVMWHEEWTHRTENIGSTGIRQQCIQGVGDVALTMVLATHRAQRRMGLRGSHCAKRLSDVVRQEIAVAKLSSHETADR